MRPTIRALTVLVVPLLAAAQPVPPSASAVAPTDADLGWLSGAWCGGEPGEQVEEVWLVPVRGESVGMSRTQRDGRVTAFEFIRIARVDGVPTYLAQPGGRPATPFARTASGPGWIRFENPAHDFPQRIEYRRTGDELVATISAPRKDGTRREIPYRYRPCVVPQRS